MAQKIWLITGTSKGFGRVWAKAALDRGDKVIATARNLADIDDLTTKYGSLVFPVKLDVTNRENCFDAVKKGVSHFGRIDILINNAGFGQFGYVEELSEAEARGQMETNFFGSLWMIQAVLPYMRKQKSGHIMQVSSVAGVVGFPYLGIYHASKFAVEGLCESLSQEVEPFGIKVTLIEPAGFATDWGTRSAKHSKPLEAYEMVRDTINKNRPKMQSGDPHATGEAILKVADAGSPPLRIFLGTAPFKMIDPLYKKKLETWKEWQKVSEKAQGVESVVL